MGFKIIEFGVDILLKNIKFEFVWEEIFQNIFYFIIQTLNDDIKTKKYWHDFIKKIKQLFCHEIVKEEIGFYIFGFEVLCHKNPIYGGNLFFFLLFFLSDQQLQD